jgi:hypothetical protein
VLDVFGVGDDCEADFRCVDDFLGGDDFGVGNEVRSDEVCCGVEGTGTSSHEEYCSNTAESWAETARGDFLVLLSSLLLVWVLGLL